MGKLNSKRGAYYVPEKHKKAWEEMNNKKFMRHLKIATNK